jgi:hypothetical protein
LYDIKYFAWLNTKRNFLLAAELLKIKQVFDLDGIKFLSFKGPSLALQAYKNLSRRVFSDLDLIIAPENFPRAMQLLMSHGYELEPRREPQIPQDLAISPLFRRLSHEQTFARRESGQEKPSFLIDVHWHGGEHSALDIDWQMLEKDATEVGIHGQTICTVATPMLLVLLCAHGTKHRWQQLKWLVDIAELIQSSDDLAWDRVYELASSQGCAKKIDLALLLCINAGLLCPAQLPDRVLNRIQDGAQLNKLASLSMKKWLTPEECHDGLRHYWQYHFLSFDNVGRAVRFFAADFFSPTLPT